MKRKYKPGTQVVISENGQRYTATILDAECDDDSYLVSDDWGKGWELAIEGKGTTQVVPGLTIQGRIIAASDIVGSVAETSSVGLLAGH
jgi:hypothetical protein